MLHFHISTFFGVGFKSHGIAIPRQAGITLIFRENEQEVAILDTKTSKVKIAWNNLANIECSRGFFAHEVSLKVAALSAVSDIPGLKENTIRLEIQKRDGEALDRFEEDVKAYRSGEITDVSDDDLDDIRDFLNRH
jgi:hypothetical protein